MLNVAMLNVNAILLNVIMLSVVMQLSSTECHYDQCHYAEYHYAECHCAECHCAECRGTFFRPQCIFKKFRKNEFQFSRLPFREDGFSFAGSKKRLNCSEAKSRKTFFFEKVTNCSKKASAFNPTKKASAFNPTKKASACNPTKKASAFHLKIAKQLTEKVGAYPKHGHMLD
jgi:hypothetical protein